MDPLIENLIRLQQLDEEIQQLTRSIAALPVHLQTLQTKLAGHQGAVAALEGKLREEEALRRRLESDLKDQQGKIVKYRKQTDSVKNNEQFHALQHEIGFAEAEIRRIEDTELESMMRAEALDAELVRARQELANHAKYLETEKEAAQRATELQTASLKKWREERAAVRPTIDEATLAHYDRVASARGTGLARASRQQCMGCQMGVRPQVWNQLRDGALMTCETCGRLLYFNPKLDPQLEVGGTRSSAQSA